MSKPRKAWAAARARDVHSTLKIGAPDEIDIERIAFFHKIAVQRQVLSGMDGRIVRDGDRAIITINASIPYPAQQRFVVAHELGHYFLHPKTRQIDVVTAEQTMNWSDRQTSFEEYEANLFAAEMLMPHSLFSACVMDAEPSFKVIEDLAREFQTTLTATAVQFVLNTNEECALVSCEGRERKWFLCPERFSFRFLNSTLVHGHSCAAQVHDRKRLDRSEISEAGWWFEGYYHNHKAYITEEARFLVHPQKVCLGVGMGVKNEGWNLHF